MNEFFMTAIDLFAALESGRTLYFAGVADWPFTEWAKKETEYGTRYVFQSKPGVATMPADGEIGVGEMIAVAV